MRYFTFVEKICRWSRYSCLNVTCQVDYSKNNLQTVKGLTSKLARLLKRFTFDIFTVLNETTLKPGLHEPQLQVQ